MNPIAVLVVEDDPADATMLIERWQERVPGCRLTLAKSYAEVREVFKTPRNFQVVCMDMRLVPDDPDGLNTLQLVRRLAPGVLIVVVSGFISREQFELFNTLGGIYACKKSTAWIDLEPLFGLLSALLSAS